MKIQNLDNLLDKNLAKELFLKYQKESGLSDDFEIIDIHRTTVLSPKTYVLLYKIIDQGKIIRIRANASYEETRARSYEVMKFTQPEFSGPAFFVPKPCFYDTDYNVITYFEVDGTVFINQLDNQNLSKEITLIAKWLGKFHSLEKPNINLIEHQPFYNFESLTRFYPDLAKQGPEIICDSKNKLSKFDEKLIHNDFQPNNIIMNNDKITLIDFNDSQIDDPAIDLAKFLTQLKTMLFRFSDVSKFTDLENIFWQNYNLQFNKENFKIYSKLSYLHILSSLSASLLEDSEEKIERKKEILAEIYKYFEEASV